MGAYQLAYEQASADAGCYRLDLPGVIRRRAVHILGHPAALLLLLVPGNPVCGLDAERH